MSCQPNTILEEEAAESFFITYLDDAAFRSMIQENYFTPEELWYAKEYDNDKYGVERTFDFLMQLDYEAACRDIIKHAYASCKKED